MVRPKVVIKHLKVLDAQQRSGEHLAVLIGPESPSRDWLGETLSFKQVEETEGWMPLI
ncbi:hypothetical protein [Thioclava nitratireducens]|nr:hypothetical protein [Thioclava nitratireducens]